MALSGGQAHAALVRSDVEMWNQWRRENPDIVPDLRGAALHAQCLRGCDLHGAIISGADLSEADLRNADLQRADLRGVQLTRADLRNADLRSAVLTDIVGGIGDSLVDITDADFTESIFGWTVIGHVYLNRIVGLGSIVHAGPSYIATSTLELTAEEVETRGALRTDVEAFLNRAGVLLSSFRQFEEALRRHEFRSAFISYSHADKDFALWLHSRLENHGVRCWLDQKNMVAGERILDAINAAISTHDRVLLCCSKSSLESWWVKDEIRKVHDVERRQRETRLIPVLLDAHLLDTWNDGLASDVRSRLGIDFSAWFRGSGGDTQIEMLLNALRKDV